MLCSLVSSDFFSALSFHPDQIPEAAEAPTQDILQPPGATGYFAVVAAFVARMCRVPAAMKLVTSMVSLSCVQA